MFEKPPLLKPAKPFTIHYLRLIAFITISLGVTMIILPIWIADLFFHAPGGDNIGFFVRMVGSTLIGYASLNLIATIDGTERLCRAAVWSNLVTLVIASIISIKYVNTFDEFGWLIISQHIFFVIGFLYCARQLGFEQK